MLAYAWSAESLTRYGNLVTLAIACGMVFFHLLTIKPHHPRRFLITATVMLLAGSGLMVLANLQSTGRAADELTIPFTAGGGVTGVDDARDLLLAGADKVAVNRAAFDDPGILSTLAAEFGSQAVVCAIDARASGGSSSA